MSLDEYLKNIETYLRNIIISCQSSDTWKIQLTIAIKFISSKDTKEEHIMHLDSDNTKFISYNEINEVFNELFESLCSKYQENLETSIKGSDVIFDWVQLMYYKCHKVNSKRGDSYIDSPNWIKMNKGTINPKNEDNKCFQYAATVTLNYDEIKWNSERVSNIWPFINKYNWERMN